ncbi:MAG: RdgB/HAM1 family non-canonical purine NTP pyrophosphatase [Opitutales bacterium]|nr:RdgB/HAM1 family non-canonical purine NTP pyrophosphatase [Opitutales bacterium]
MPPRTFLATNNAHKASELAALWRSGGGPGELLSARACGGMPEVEETGQTFGDNALLKARALLKQLEPGTYALADDSGLEVDALNGAPGLYSARYAGPTATDLDNLRFLLENMRTVPDARRTARFRCTLCLLDATGQTWFFEGSCEGHILRESQGSEGFGYDPVFQPEGFHQSFASLGASVKSRLSHRARALQNLIARWPGPPEG